MQVAIEVLRVSDQKHCVKFSYRSIASKRDVTNVSAINHFINFRSIPTLKMFCDATYDGE